MKITQNEENCKHDKSSGTKKSSRQFRRPSSLFDQSGKHASANVPLCPNPTTSEQSATGSPPTRPSLHSAGQGFMLTIYTLLPVTIQALLASFLWPHTNRSGATTPLRFQLRHQHAISNTSRVIFSDIFLSFVPEVYRVDTRHITSYRPTSFLSFSNARLRSMRHAQNDASIWQESDILGPNVTERETLLTLAKMTNNAYNKPTDEEWYDLGSGWNSVSYGIFPSALIYN